MKEFKHGDKIPLAGGAGACEIQDKLGEGGQGIVYKVSLNGKPYALKWYFANKLQNKTKFMKYIEENIKRTSPNEDFLWPQYLTSEKDGSFGYIMDIRPKEYSDFSDILLNKVKLSAPATMTAALNLVSAFRALHGKGLSYQDLNDGNFFINAKTGAVLICDNDNVTPNGEPNAGNIGGKPGYMAPEIVCGKAKPDTYTDAHSLAVILFKLFVRHDPLMGVKYVNSVCITEAKELELYGTNPVFIYDPNDKSNRPAAGVHNNAINFWPLFPKFFQDAFIKSFCEGMKNPHVRLAESQWEKVLIQLRDELLECPKCKRNILLKDSTIKIICSGCKMEFNPPFRLDVNGYKIPLFPGVKIYERHIGDSTDYEKSVGEVIMNKSNPSLWGIKNISDTIWVMSAPGKEDKQIAKDAVVPVAEGVSAKFKNCSGKIVKP